MEYSAVAEEKDERSSYYGGASIPFVWESRPGTPKNNHFSDFSLPPPLTPPPSYYSSSGVLSTPKRQNKVRTKLTRILSMSLFHDLRKSSSSSRNNYVSSSSSFSSLPPVLYVSHREHELRPSSTSALRYSNGGRKKFKFFNGEYEESFLLCSYWTGNALTIGNVNKA